MIISLFLIEVFFISLVYSKKLDDVQSKKNINQEIDFNFDETIAGVSTERTRMPVKVQIDPLPELNVTSKVTVKILIMEFFKDTLFQRCDHSCNMEISSFNIHYDQIYQTNEMKKEKVKLVEGELYITPLGIGDYLLRIIVGYHPIYKNHKESFTIGFRLDELGKLIYLGKYHERYQHLPPKELPNHPPLNTETIMLHHPNTCQSFVNSDFDCHLLISPPFSLNKVSTVQVHLTAQASYPDGIEFSISHYPDILMAEVPKTWMGPVATGDKFTTEFTVEPQKTGASTFILSVLAWPTEKEIKSGKRRGKLIFTVYYALDSSGNPYYIGTESIENWYRQYFPKKLARLKLPPRKEYRTKFSIPALKRE